MTTLGSNIASLRALRTLSQSSDSLERSFEKLSSGLRINRASDDAAGLAIALSLNASSRVQSVGIRNINDGISVLNIIDSSLKTQTDIVTRLAELAEQASNGSLSASQRRSLDKEYLSLVSEFGRIGETAAFNKQKLLSSRRSDGISSIAFQVGTTGNANSVISLSAIDAGAVSGIIDANTLSQEGPLGTGGTNGQIREYFGNSFITYERNGVKYGIGLHWDSFMLGWEAFSYSEATDSWTLYDPGSAEAYDFTSSGYLDSISVTTIRNVTGLDLSALRISDSAGIMGPNIGVQTLLELGTFHNVQTSRTTLDTVRNRLSELSRQRGEFGALESRIHVSRSVLEASLIGTKSAESRIMDIDVAEETAKLTSSKILQETGSAVLAQANQQPEIALRLLNF